MYKIDKDDLHKKEIDDISQFFSFDVKEKNLMISTPANVLSSSPPPPKESIIEDELDEFLREFESHDETVAEKSKSPIEINENIKNGNNYVSDTISIHRNQKEILKNEDLKMTIEYPKEKNNIENSREYANFFDKESYIQEEEKLRESSGLNDIYFKKEEKLHGPEKNKIKTEVNVCKVLEYKNSPKNEKETDKLLKSRKENDKKKQKNIIIKDSKEIDMEYLTKNGTIDEKNTQKIRSSQETEIKSCKQKVESPKLENSKLNHKKKSVEPKNIIKYEEIQTIKTMNNKKIPAEKLENEINTLEKDSKKSKRKRIKKEEKKEEEKDVNKPVKYHNSQDSQRLKISENEIKQENNEMKDHVISENKSIDDDNFNLMEKMFGSPKCNNYFIDIEKKTPEKEDKELIKEHISRDESDLFIKSVSNTNYEFEDSLSEELFGTPIRPIKKEEKQVKQELYKIEEITKEIKGSPNKFEEYKENPKKSLENEFKIKKKKEAKEEKEEKEGKRGEKEEKEEKKVKEVKEEKNSKNKNHDFGSEIRSESKKHKEGSFKVF